MYLSRSLEKTLTVFARTMQVRAKCRSKLLQLAFYSDGPFVHRNRGVVRLFFDSGNQSVSTRKAGVLSERVAIKRNACHLGFRMETNTSLAHPLAHEEEERVALDADLLTQSRHLVCVSASIQGKSVGIGEDNPD